MLRRDIRIKGYLKRELKKKIHPTRYCTKKQHKVQTTTQSREAMLRTVTIEFQSNLLFSRLAMVEYLS